MRKFSCLMLLLLAVMIPVCAQNKDKDRQNMRKEITEFKMKYLAQEMELKDDQQKKFFELYSQMSEEKGKLFRETKALEKKLSDSKDASDEEYQKVSKAITAAKEKEAEIDKKYDEKFSEFLSQKQIFKMKSAEEQFRNKMHEMRHKTRGKTQKVKK